MLSCYVEEKNKSDLSPAGAGAGSLGLQLSSAQLSSALSLTHSYSAIADSRRQLTAADQSQSQRHRTVRGQSQLTADQQPVSLLYVTSRTHYSHYFSFLSALLCRQ